MQAAQTQFNIRAIQSSWSKLDSMVHLRPIHDEAGYEQMTSLMNSLLDVVGNNEDHALSGLLELVGDLVSKFEQASYATEAAEPVDSLRRSKPVDSSRRICVPSSYFCAEVASSPSLACTKQPTFKPGVVAHCPPQNSLSP